MPTPDYKDDLVFKPAMTWEELCNKWQKYVFVDVLHVKSADSDDDSFIYFDNTGDIIAETTVYDRETDLRYGVDIVIAYKASYEEMDTLITILDRRCK